MLNDLDGSHIRINYYNNIRLLFNEKSIINDQWIYKIIFEYMLFPIENIQKEILKYKLSWPEHHSYDYDEVMKNTHYNMNWCENMTRYFNEHEYHEQQFSVTVSLYCKSWYTYYKTLLYIRENTIDIDKYDLCHPDENDSNEPKRLSPSEIFNHLIQLLYQGENQKICCSYCQDEEDKNNWKEYHHKYQDKCEALLLSFILYQQYQENYEHFEIFKEIINQNINILKHPYFICAITNYLNFAHITTSHYFDGIINTVDKEEKMQLIFSKILSSFFDICGGNQKEKEQDQNHERGIMRSLINSVFIDAVFGDQHTQYVLTQLYYRIIDNNIDNSDDHQYDVVWHYNLSQQGYHLNKLLSYHTRYISDTILEILNKFI